MKKVMALIGILSFGFFTTEAQNYARNRYDNGYWNESKNDSYRNRDRRDHESLRIDSFQKRAKMRINKGIANGLITRREADRLWDEYRMIERKENRYLRNGRLSPREIDELENDLFRLNRMINKEKNDWNRSRNRF